MWVAAVVSWAWFWARMFVQVPVFSRVDVFFTVVVSAGRVLHAVYPIGPSPMAAVCGSAVDGLSVNVPSAHCC